MLLYNFIDHNVGHCFWDLKTNNYNSISYIALTLFIFSTAFLLMAFYNIKIVILVNIRTRFFCYPANIRPGGFNKNCDLKINLI